jgi:SAM-dependent methyltransferase
LYDEKQGDEGDLWHREALDPPLFALLGDVTGMRVLDVACGNGHNARRLARLGAQVTGVDFSPEIITRCRTREQQEPLGIMYHVADAARLNMFDDALFDLAICQMALMDIADAEGAVREVARTLRPAGRLVAQFLHPCFFVPEASSWVVERMGPDTTFWRKVRRYREPFQGKVYWREGDDLIYTASYHRPLSWYVRVLREASLALTALEEPVPPLEFLALRQDGPCLAEIPLHCLIEAHKLPL